MLFRDLKTAKARREHIRNMLSTDPIWTSRGLVRIFEHQTADEQRSEDVKHNNGIGFTPADGHLLSSFAKQFIHRKFLSEKQVAILFRKMPKYAGQLERIAEKGA